MFCALQKSAGALNLACERVLLARAVSQSSGHIANGAFGPIFNNSRHLSGTAPTVALKNILNNFFPATGFKININIGFFITQRREKTLERQVVVNRIHGGDVEKETHCRVSSRSTPLTEDSARARKTHDVVNDQEISRKILLLDDIELLGNTSVHFCGGTGIASRHSLSNELLQVTHGGVPWRA